MIETLDISLDRSSGRPLNVQIADAIRGIIQRGRLQPGVKLPSTRAIADGLGVHRKTVVLAFHRLQDEGWVTSGVGQGTFVQRLGDPARETADRDTDSESDGPAPRAGGRFDWSGSEVTRERDFDIWRFWDGDPVPDGAIRLTGATADPAFFPAGEIREVIDEVLRHEGGAALDYGPAEGLLSLREWLADRLRARHVDVEPDQVLIVNGSQQGMDLVARLMIRSGDRVLVEEPSYSNGFRLFQAHGARTLGVSMDNGGIQLDALERACNTQVCKLLYVMPVFQNPTGLVLEPDRVPGLLDLAARHRFPVLEDHFDADLFYEGDCPPPLKAKDEHDQVIFLGTFSKILFPGFRLGWLLLPRELLQPARELKQMTDLSTGLLAQLAMNLYCRRGLLDQHLERIREVNRRRLAVLLESLDEHFPPEAVWTRPRGGMTAWVKLPPGIDSLDLLQRARREGVDFSPGALFFPEGGGSEHMRLTFVRETEERLERGVEILGRLIRETARSRSRSGQGRPFL